MSEQTTETPPAQETKPPEPTSGKPGEKPTEDTTDWKAEARKHEQRAKEHKSRADELEKQRKASMTEAERAISEAESKGRTAATAEFGKRLARTQFDAAAARRNKDFDTASALEYVDLAKFVGEDGEPNTKAINAAVERLVPEPADGPPSFDGGTRTPTAKTGDMNQIIRRAAGHGG